MEHMYEERKMPTIGASATVPCCSIHTASAILREHRILVDSSISYVDCITNHHKLSGRKQYTFLSNSFCGWGVWALLSWALRVGTHKAAFKAGCLHSHLGA